jgi:signal transduction histidine kinase
MFSNPAMDALLPEMSDAVRSLVDRTLASRNPQGPITMSYRTHAQTDGAPAESTELLLITHPIDDENGHFVGAMLVARNLGFMTQVHSTLNYSRKLAALGRLMAGVAHEVKNPLNAMTIHLELLRNKLTRVPVPALSGAPGASGPALERAPSADVAKHVDIISREITRLDQVLNGFLRFARPDELRLQPLRLETVVSDIVTTIAPEAERMRITVRSECPHNLPDVNADAAMLRQAVLNLALNACQAMPDGGILKIACRAGARGRVEVDVEDTGVGIAPENLQKIFDLYFTTKETGTGIGLSMVYRIVQLHDGEVEVQSTPGRGTRFRLVLPQA